MSAVAYIRASTEEQRNSLTAQQSRIEDYCRWKNLELVETFIDSGVSGSTPFLERPQGRALMEFRDLSRIPAIIIAKVDRAFRNTADCLITIQAWSQAGIQVHLLDMDLDTSTPNGMLFLTMTAALAQWELGRRRERQADGIRVMRAQSLRLGEVPYGWMAVPESGLGLSRRGNAACRLIPDPYEQSVLRDHIRPARDRGDSAATIAAALTAARIPTKKNRLRWHPIVVQGILDRLDDPVAGDAPAIAHRLTAGNL